MGRRKKEATVLSVPALDVVIAEIPRDPGVRLQGWPPFGARVLVWDERYDQWAIAYYVRVGHSEMQGRFEEWFKGEARPVPGRIWQYLPAAPNAKEPKQ